MLTKIITFLITAVITGGIGAMMFFMLILSLNGFTGKQAEPGLILYIAWAVLTVIIAGALSFLGANYLINNKSFNPVLAAITAIALFSFGGAASDFVGFIAAIFLTSAMR